MREWAKENREPFGQRSEKGYNLEYVQPNTIIVKLLLGKTWQFKRRWKSASKK